MTASFNLNALPMLVSVLVGFAVIVFFFISIIRKSRAQAPDEKSLVPLYKTSCGSVMDYLRSTAPFNELRIYRGMIVIGSGKGTFIFRPSQIARITYGAQKGLLVPGLSLEHVITDYPRTIVLMLIDSSTAIEALKQAGFIVTNT